MKTNEACKRVKSMFELYKAAYEWVGAEGVSAYFSSVGFRSISIAYGASIP